MKSNATFSFFRRRECLCRHSNPHPRRTWLAKGVRFREMAPGWFAGVAMAGRSSISVWIIGCTRFRYRGRLNLASPSRCFASRVLPNTGLPARGRGSKSAISKINCLPSRDCKERYSRARFFALDAGLQVYEVEILMLNLSTPPSSKVPFTLSLCEAIVDSRDEPVDTRDSEAV